MKGKIFKISVILLVILAMTMANFIFVGSNIISYALDNISTNNNNVEFGVYFKDSNGNQVSNIEKSIYNEDAKLYLHLKVKQQGYFNGKVELENSNFTLKEVQNDYINKIEGNVITLNQINAGSEVELEIPIELQKQEAFNIGLLNMESIVKLNGVYRDSSEKDKEVESSKKVTLKIVPENQTSENIEKSTKIITNKTLKVVGEDKRVVQILLNVGLKDNSYPIKEINVNANVPEMNATKADASAVVNLNTMTNYQSNYENNQINVNLKNDVSQENNVIWKKSGSEGIVLTYLYDINNIKNITVNGKVEVTLYNDTKIEANIDDIVVNKDEEKEEILTTGLEEFETTMYKGKLYQGIDREYTTKETINVNTTSILDHIEIKEQDVFATQADYQKNVPLQGTVANTVYRRTTINKEQLFNVLGENGNVVVKNGNGEQITVITKDTETDANGNIVIDYGEAGQAGVVIRTTAPVAGGKINITHNKIIKQNDVKLIQNSIDFNTALFVTTNLNEGDVNPKQVSKIKLEETVTEATLEINKTELSTVIENDVELKAVLKSKNESNDLYKNPVLKIEFPEEIEQITVNNISMLYENELQIKTANLNGKVLTIEMQGEQTHYSESAIEGPTIIINGKLKLNRKVATKDTQITMNYSNEKAKAYVNNAVASAAVKLVAPTDVTTVTTIEQLGIEEINQDTSKEVMLERGTAAKEITPQIEIINNKENAITDIKVLGTFPTGEGEDSVGIDVASPISVENATVYYSENENATDDLSNGDNGWTEQITDASSVKKYLITANEINSQESIIASYSAVIPENLEYNENASQTYTVAYTDAATNSSDLVKATQVNLTTGVGPKLEAKISATVGQDTLKSGDEVKAGEVIKYHLEVSNTGTEIANNITISGMVPEGTTYVQAKDNYEYTGASYYKEITDKKSYEESVEKIEVGETVTKEYEVRVNKDITDGTVTSNKCTAKFDDVTTESEEIKSTLKSGDIRVSVKRVTDRRSSLYNDGEISYIAIIENTSSSTKENVKINTNLSNGLGVKIVTLYTGDLDPSIEISDEDLRDMDDAPNEEEFNNDAQEDPNEASQNINEEDIEYSNEINLGTFNAGEIKALQYICTIGNVEKIAFSTLANQKDNIYRSNVWNETVLKRDIGISMESNSKDKYLKSGDEFDYIITIVNKGNKDDLIKLEDQVPKELEIKDATLNGKNIEKLFDNEISTYFDLFKGEQAVLKISVKVIDSGYNEAKTITNKATASIEGIKVAETQEITHIIQPNDNQGSSDNGNNIDDNNVANGNKIISGIAWYDENTNGKKDDNESTLNGITVNLLNAETNQLVKDKSGNTLSATTSDNGTYILSNIGNGKYIVVFNYNTTQYALTKYKVEGVDETKNSNATMNDLSIDGTNKKIASTDIIQINNNNISDINIGLIKLQNFDLKLDKYVSKVVVQNSAGTSSTEYTDSTMAKAEIHSKYINGSTVLIEYKIRVTNAGEVEGYAKKIVDYIPSDLKFSSELNKDWYQSGTNLYNASLANEKILAGETRELTLILTKSMTENNTGLVNNTAEIAEAYNELGLADSNSTPGNKTQGENDMGSADVIISIKTGEFIFYTTLIAVITLVVLSAIAVPIVKNVKKNKNKLDKI